jgi:predicted dithiol-disulfide oxidoreductase (DUF899 family)
MMALPAVVSREEWLEARVRLLARELRSRPGRARHSTGCFLRDGDEIFHTYSAYARGTEDLVPAYRLLDLTAFGRSEEWEEPRGRARVLHGADPTFTD